MALTVIAKRGDSLLITDPDAGPGAIVYLDGDASVFHRDTAAAAGYWEETNDPLPDLPAEAVADLADFNDRWYRSHPLPDEPDLDDEMRARGQSLVDGIDEDGPDDDEDLYRADVVDNQLKHYWTRGKGLRKWATSAHPWTALYRHLVKHVGPERAKRMASQWFRLVFGIWSGERKGDNPVGPG